MTRTPDTLVIIDGSVYRMSPRASTEWLSARAEGRTCLPDELRGCKFVGTPLHWTDLSAEEARDVLAVLNSA